MRNPVFAGLLDEMRVLHERKNHDYANDDNPYSNFEQAAETAAGFVGVDAVFAALIGVKLARLRELTRTGKAPNNESLQDTRTDLAMYAALWAAYHRSFDVHESRTSIDNEQAAASNTVHNRRSYDDIRHDAGPCLCGRLYTHPGYCERTGTCGALEHPHAG